MPSISPIFFLPFSLFFIFFFLSWVVRRQRLERAFTFVVYFAERSEIARGYLESSGVIVNACAAYTGRVLYFSWFFFLFHKEERSTEYLLLCRNTERQSLNNGGQPSTDNAASLKVFSTKRNRASYIYIRTYVFFFTHLAAVGKTNYFNVINSFSMISRLSLYI